MAWQNLAWQCLANAVVGGLVVLALGAVAVRICRQPARRARLIVLTIAGALAVPCLGSIGIAPPIPLRIPAGAWRAGGPPSPAAEVPVLVPGRIPRRSPARPGSGAVADPGLAGRRAVIGDGRRGSGISATVSSLADLPWRRLVLVAHAMASAGLLAWWVFGQAVLWHLTRGARPAPSAVRDRFRAMTGRAGERVRLLVSDRIALPFTYTWAAPMIVLPAGLCTGDDEAVKYALAHEWSHVERRDAWAWNLAAMAAAVLFYQPLFWWLRRQLRLSQDDLADDRAAAAGSPEDYAACLVRLARDARRASGPAVAGAMPALGILDRPSNLSRRVAMLINDRGPIEHRCPRAWSLGAAAAAVLAILAVAGLRADATPADAPVPQAPKAAPAPAGAEVKKATRQDSAVSGRVETPDGAPAQGVVIEAYSLSHKVEEGPREDGLSARVQTDRDGRFRVPVKTPGLGMFWILPAGFAPESHAIPSDRRGDLGTFTLKTGITARGRAVDDKGKPLAGMFVNMERDRDRSPDRELLDALACSDRIGRQAETDAEGRFTFEPLPAGVYVVQPTADQEVPGKRRVHRPLPGVFSLQKVTLREGETPRPIEIRPAPSLVIEGGWVDSKGRPHRGGQLLVIGHVDEESWHTMVNPAADGKFSMRIPRGMTGLQITLFMGQFTSTRYRIGKDGKLQAGQYIMFGKRTLDHDVKDIALIHYEDTIAIVKPTAKDGRPLKGVELAGEYTSEPAMARGGFVLKNGAFTEVLFDRQPDGRYRSDELVPDREVTITAYADSFKPASRKIKLSEGKTEEIRLVLEPR